MHPNIPAGFGIDTFKKDFIIEFKKRVVQNKSSLLLIKCGLEVSHLLALIIFTKGVFQIYIISDTTFTPHSLHYRQGIQQDRTHGVFW